MLVAISRHYITIYARHIFTLAHTHQLRRCKTIAGFLNMLVSINIIRRVWARTWWWFHTEYILCVLQLTSLRNRTSDNNLAYTITSLLFIRISWFSVATNNCLQVWPDISDKNRCIMRYTNGNGANHNVLRQTGEGTVNAGTPNPSKGTKKKTDFKV